MNLLKSAKLICVADLQRPNPDEQEKDDWIDLLCARRAFKKPSIKNSLSEYIDTRFLLPETNIAEILLSKVGYVI